MLSTWSKAAKRSPSSRRAREGAAACLAPGSIMLLWTVTGLPVGTGVPDLCLPVGLGALNLFRGVDGGPQREDVADVAGQLSQESRLGGGVVSPEPFVGAELLLLLLLEG